MRQKSKSLWTQYKAESLKRGVEVCNVFVSLVIDLESASNHDNYDE